MICSCLYYDVYEIFQVQYVLCGVSISKVGIQFLVPKLFPKLKFNSKIIEINLREIKYFSSFKLTEFKYFFLE